MDKVDIVIDKEKKEAIDSDDEMNELLNDDIFDTYKNIR